MGLEIGSRIGHYDVTALIGEGGMGQVYQSTDTKLNRRETVGVEAEVVVPDAVTWLVDLFWHWQQHEVFDTELEGDRSSSFNPSTSVPIRCRVKSRC